METKLNTFGREEGWVFGAWGEVSEEVHDLVQRLTKARLERLETLPMYCEKKAGVQDSYALGSCR